MLNYIHIMRLALKLMGTFYPKSEWDMYRLPSLGPKKPPTTLPWWSMGVKKLGPLLQHPTSPLRHPDSPRKHVLLPVLM